MGTNQSGQAPNSQAYVLRIWRNESGGRWHFSIQDVTNGERYGFADLDSFLVHFYSLIPGRDQTAAGDPVDAPAPHKPDEA